MKSLKRTRGRCLPAASRHPIAGIVDIIDIVAALAGQDIGSARHRADPRQAAEKALVATAAVEPVVDA